MLGRSSTKKILIVEDNVDLNTALKKKLEKEGYETLSAYDGQEGTDLAKEHKPHLILLDLVLPRVSGVEFLAKMDEDRWGKTVPVIVLTNLTHFTHLEQMYDRNVCAYLVKTAWSLEDVVKKVREVLD